MELILIRHGLPVRSAETSDPPLSDEGHEQARRAASWLAGERIGAVYASPMLRAVQTADFMTAQWAPLPHELLARISNRIINEVRGINRVAYDISSKPPATIEWE